ncbi:hypothetical protein SAMN04489796_1046 [Winogradskyella thalassocola]|uniref:Uncharacterized protein n=2 Tax=Winogradskyella thalassocola TaxID=262004 RepID=A0A1G8EQD2_9FLAO|nr:hypothetical protein SAMN04489796_1046 [Winogradskyella thalassocola]
MIKFFRKIRYDLMEKNKTGKYFKYAIGEIILVVIGILIALSINNWNENVKTHRNQRNNLQLIKVEMINNLQAIVEANKDLSKTITSCRDLINLNNTDNNLKNIEEHQLSSLIAGLVRDDVQAFLENGVMNQLLASDGLKNIENDSIRNILASWQSKIDYVRLQEQHIFSAQSRIREYISTNGNMKVLFEGIGLSQRMKLDTSLVKVSNKHLLMDKKLENTTLILLVSGVSLQENIYPEFKNEIHSIVGLIDLELEKK